MKVEKREVSYVFKRTDFTHHVIYLRDGEKKILLSPFNLFLKDRASSSLKTSARYSGNICKFLNFISKRYHDDGEKFWLSASNEDLHDWQREQVFNRDKNKKMKPSDKTISQNAALIHDAYSWLKVNNFPISMQIHNREWKFNYKGESMLRHVRGQLSRTIGDRRQISKGFARFDDRNKNDFTIMSLHDRERLMAAYKDPVYSACFLLALATGMREEGICKMPYLGTGENFHIRPYPEILAEIGNSKTFRYTVVEKGKRRTLHINTKAWEAICKMYLPLYFERRKLLENRFPTVDPNQVFFINRLGRPVSPEMISRMTNVAKRQLSDFPWTFHSARSWFATQYMINNLSKTEIQTQHYNAAVEEGLRKQLGHSDIKTTYKHYLRMASIAITVNDGAIGQDTWRDLEETANRAMRKNP